MSAAPSAKSSAAARLVETGLRNYWYPIAPSYHVHQTAVGLTRLGERIVVWRDSAGKVHALEDRCPHRGARPSGFLLAGVGGTEQRFVFGPIKSVSFALLIA